MSHYNRPKMIFLCYTYTFERYPFVCLRGFGVVQVDYHTAQADLEHSVQPRVILILVLPALPMCWDYSSIHLKHF